MGVVKRNNLWLLFLFSMTAVGLLGGSAGAQDPVWQVIEDWELVVASPDNGTSGPQVTCTISPLGDLSGQYATFDVNHRASPSFTAGGMHLHLWDGQTRLGTLSRQSGMVLSTTDEILTWKTIMSVDAGVLIVDIDSGVSTTWGAFGSTILSSVATTLTNLDQYSPDVSVAHSGIGFASNRVTSLKLKSVTYRRVSGATTVDATERVLHLVE
jgi:hypothetical protein